MELIYRTLMRYGSRLLLLAAVLMAASGILQAVVAVIFNARSSGRLEWWLSLSGIMQGLVQACWPLFFALLIDRLDVWLSRKPPENAN